MGQELNKIWLTKTPPEIVYEDDDIVIVNKPWGLISHPKNKEDKSYSVTQWFAEKYPDSKEVGDDSIRPGMMHRLDRETSGLLILAKNKNSFSFMKKQFQERIIEKSYLALVKGCPQSKEGTIDSAIGRVGIKRTTREKDGHLNDRKEALTHYKVLRKFQEYSLLEVSPKTGRTHQIRVHLKSIGFPVLGDKLYNPKESEAPKDLTRLFLHAFRLKFVSPSGKALTIEADLPEDLQNVINTLE